MNARRRGRAPEIGDLASFQSESSALSRHSNLQLKASGCDFFMHAARARSYISSDATTGFLIKDRIPGGRRGICLRELSRPAPLESRLERQYYQRRRREAHLDM